MILPVEQLILQQAQALVATHADALQDALHSLRQDSVELNELSELSKERRRAEQCRIFSLIALHGCLYTGWFSDDQS
ncbi:MAG: hypothetical protein IE928_01635, partial [Gammaproteobacteria bacterium]|nr:hypothetical protein [Gammaproteobacteria bacterium]